MNTSLPIGVFDSGVGGLTVLQSIRHVLPNEHLIYLGDTARVPYGTKTASSVKQYAKQAAAALVKQDVKAIVIACNTASAFAIDYLRSLFPDIPVIGVIEPGAIAGCAHAINNKVAVIGTEGTIENDAYANAIALINQDINVQSKATSMLVALAEEGWVDDDISKQVVTKYLSAWLEVFKPSCLVLGCTHFPLLQKAIAHVIGEDIVIVDSASTTAQHLRQLLENKKLLNTHHVNGDIRFLVTDGTKRFQKIAHRFFQEPITLSDIQLIDIQN